MQAGPALRLNHDSTSSQGICKGQTNCGTGNQPVFLQFFNRSSVPIGLLLACLEMDDLRTDNRQLRREIEELRRVLQTTLGASIFGAAGIPGRKLKNPAEKQLANSPHTANAGLGFPMANALNARSYDSVTVMFTDFQGFTQIGEQLSPEQLVEEIDLCFRAFDEITARYPIEKIKTVGDSYLCAGGLPAANGTHAVDVVSAALDFQAFMAELKKRKQAQGLPYFEMRIGIHTGPVVAGVVGLKKAAYDIWGDTVNPTSRMETPGEVWKINISESTWNLVKDHFHCTPGEKSPRRTRGKSRCSSSTPKKAHERALGPAPAAAAAHASSSSPRRAIRCWLARSGSSGHSQHGAARSRERTALRRHEPRDQA